MRLKNSEKAALLLAVYLLYKKNKEDREDKDRDIIMNFNDSTVHNMTITEEDKTKTEEDKTKTEEDKNKTEEDKNKTEEIINHVSFNSELNELKKGNRYHYFHDLNIDLSHENFDIIKNGFNNILNNNKEINVKKNWMQIVNEFREQNTISFDTGDVQLILSETNRVLLYNIIDKIFIFDHDFREGMFYFYLIVLYLFKFKGIIQ